MGRGARDPRQAGVVARLWELAALGLALIVAGVIVADPELPAEARLGALVALTGAVLVVGRLPRRGRD